jgi:hypothetical protein
MSRLLSNHRTTILLVAILPLMALAGNKANNDSSSLGIDSSLPPLPKKVYRYSFRRDEIIRLISPIIDIRASYPLLIGLETGLIFNLTASREAEHYDPINGPAVFTELSYP